MGMYVCLPCIEEHALEPSGGISAQGYGICEVCHKDRVWRNFTWDLTRFGAPVEEQLKKHKKLESND